MDPSGLTPSGLTPSGLTRGPTNSGWAKLVLAKIACCGALLLFATGVLTLNGVGAWLRDGGLVWLSTGAVAATAFFLLWRRRRSQLSHVEGRGAALFPESSLIPTPTTEPKVDHE